MDYIDVKNKRKQYKISQIKLANATGFSPAKISSWELNKACPTQEELAILNDCLERIINDIVVGASDIRKKKIQHSGTGKNQPTKIVTPLDYNNKISCRSFSTACQYKDQLSRLYSDATSRKKESAPKAIALFSGCGGLSLGFSAAGFNLVGHVDIESSANEIYHNNFKDSDLLGTDICTISDKEIKSWISKYGEIDILIGGPPCQGFSLAGKRDPEDARNQLYQQYVHIVDIIQPKVFLMENVRLMTSMKMSDGDFFINQIKNSFEQVGYTITQHEINVNDYGVPQFRERVILIGIRNDINNQVFQFPKPLDKSISSKTFRDATCDLPHLESGESSSDPLHWCVNHPQHVIEWLKDVPEGHSAHENEDPRLRPPSGFNTTYKRICWDEPCSTITTNFSMISGCRNVHPEDTRSLTIREAARAQSFPDEFVFTGKWGDIRKAIGNAVPPLFAEKIAEAIMKQFFD